MSAYPQYENTVCEYCGEKLPRGSTSCHEECHPHEDIVLHSIGAQYFARHTCSYCDVDMMSASKLENHILVHERPFRCPVNGCPRSEMGRGFTIPNDLYRHKRTKHVPSPAYYWICASASCVQGSRIWPGLDSLKQHVRSIHVDENAQQLRPKEAERQLPRIGAPILGADQESYNSDPKDATIVIAETNVLRFGSTSGREQPRPDPKSRMEVQSYTIGWICALPLELAVSLEMLDEEYESLKPSHSGNSTYSFGRIGRYNIVLACLPAGCIGTSRAAAVSTHMQMSFRSIEMVLLVGIGGGLAVNEEGESIALGDVAVSQPTWNKTGVVQYDMGRVTENGFVVGTRWLNAPPDSALTAVAFMKAEAMRRPQYGFSRHIHRLDHLPDFGTKCYAGPAPRAHYGAMASGNWIMRDSIQRETVSEALGGVICFEMEAAGLVPELSRIGIRGISDFADGSKSKQPQPFAAATAAAYARELLLTLPQADSPKIYMQEVQDLWRHRKSTCARNSLVLYRWLSGNNNGMGC